LILFVDKKINQSNKKVCFQQRKLVKKIPTLSNANPPGTCLCAQILSYPADSIPKQFYKLRFEEVNSVMVFALNYVMNHKSLKARTVRNVLNHKGELSRNMHSKKPLRFLLNDQKKA
jgi:hypothetical protein